MSDIGLVAARKPPDIRERFGVAVRRRRETLALSQEEVAARAGLHRSYIGDVERGQRNVAIVNIEKIADALGLTPSGLLALTEEAH